MVEGGWCMQMRKRERGAGRGEGTRKKNAEERKGNEGKGSIVRGGGGFRKRKIREGERRGRGLGMRKITEMAYLIYVHVCVSLSFYFSPFLRFPLSSCLSFSTFLFPPPPLSLSLSLTLPFCICLSCHFFCFLSPSLSGFPLPLSSSVPNDRLCFCHATGTTTRRLQIPRNR